jgi:2-hydroxychromene-2-carboxylate isomerase
MTAFLTSTIDFYWDLGSTNTYFAIKLLKPIALKYDAEIRWHAFNVGHVFQANNYVLMDEPKEKLRNRKDDLMRWAKKYNLPFQVPKAFPIKTSRALRGAIAMRAWNKESEFIEKIFEAYWEQGDGSIGDYVTLRKIAAVLGVNGDEFETAAESEAVRTQLIDSTNQAQQRGVFGVPSIYIEDELYWGKDRMEFVEAHLAHLA